jgi:hypothetical protein
MPYIPAVDRTPFDLDIEIIARKVDTPGQLAYIVYRLMGRVVSRWGGHFEDFATVRGAMLEAVDEFRRRQTAPYEDAKKAENGDVAI